MYIDSSDAIGNDITMWRICVSNGNAVRISHHLIWH